MSEQNEYVNTIGISLGESYKCESVSLRMAQGNCVIYFHGSNAQIREFACRLLESINEAELRAARVSPVLDPAPTLIGTCKHCGATGNLGDKCGFCTPLDDLGPMVFTL
jgi:hypothetical protein